VQTILYLLILCSWIWSVARGIQVSLICAIANFIFPPVSQLIFSIYEDKMRAPLFFMAVGVIGLYLTGHSPVTVHK